MRNSGKLGSITYTKQVPNFLATFGGGGGASDEGIAGALRRHKDEAEDRSDAEDEKPQVVEAEDAMATRDRSRGPTGQASSLFKSQGLAGDRFADSAYKRVREHAREQQQKQHRKDPALVEDATSGGVSGKHVFKESTRLKKKRPERRPSSTEKGMLSFTEEDE
eukprot:CAMPEP_0119376514 /NCGR_PEP_ID=MMETSP1334-20130426/40118_1 /TAXON_ID=127549 /ORGANISM="Calcidiscus leptoporus, Strain RCC1130" /LENGTH=163 /DNA_ID=CAMNT_0007395081 /DNA_START=27 /DNA_END=518 /DNA_ORIENTATION=+